MTPLGILAAILAATLALFIWGRWRHDLVAACALLASVLLGVVDPKKAFDGFSDPAVITVALVLVLSASIRQSGLLERLMRRLGPYISSPNALVLVFTGVTALLSAFMNNVGALAVMMPIAMIAAQKAGYRPAVILMPVAFGSLLGGLITLIGTPPNLLISNVRQEAVGIPFNMFDFAPVGLALTVLGLAYLMFGWRLLPVDRTGTPTPESRFTIKDYVTEVKVPVGSPLAGKTVAEVEASADDDISILAVIRGDVRRISPARSTTLQHTDVILVEADSAALKRIIDANKLELVGSKGVSEETLASEGYGSAEAVVTGRSPLIGRSPLDFGLRRYGVNLLAISRRGGRTSSRLRHIRFSEGDVLVLQGNLDQMPVTLQELGCLPLAERKIALGRPVREAVPAVIMAVAVLLTALELLPVSIAFLGAVVMIGLLRVMPLNDMYESIDWSVIVLLGALIPVTEAMQSTGGTEVISTAVASVAGAWPPVAALMLMLAATMAITPVLNNAATVLLMGPIAAGYAKQLGLSVDPFLMAVAVGASCDFLTPFGHQSNTLVYGPGGYAFGDYARLGAPLTLIIFVASIPLIVFVWPFKP